MKLIILLFLLSMSAYADITNVFDSRGNRFISYAEMIQTLNISDYVVLGEFHNNEPIQKAQAQVISDTVQSNHHENNFQVMWEFLNFTEQGLIDLEFQNFKNGNISSQEFLNRTAGKQNFSYAPIIETTKAFGGNIFGINLPREIKEKVMKEGINSVDPKLIPPSHYVGDAQYLERFSESMGGHVPPEKIQQYFLAQCLTDSVMAHQTTLHHKNQSFIVAGSFHTDFYDATVIRLQKLTDKKIATLKLVNENELTAEEKDELISGHPQYGHYADYIVFTR